MSPRHDIPPMRRWAFKRIGSDSVRLLNGSLPLIPSGLAITLLFVSSGCSQEARLVRVTPQNSLVTYPIETEGDILSSRGRGDALRLIEEECPHGSRIEREGEVPKVSAAADRAWRGQMGTDRLWGIQFRCK